MKELNFSFLLTVFKKHWWKIVAVTLLVMILAACVTQFLIPKKYSSSVKFYVVNVNTDLDYTSATYLAAAEYLVNDYVEIIQGDTLLTEISDTLKSEGYKVSPNTLRGMIKSSSKAETSVFTITVSHTDKKLAYRVAQLLEEIAPPIVTEFAKPGDTVGKRAASNVQTVLESMVKDKEIPLTEEQIPTQAAIEQHLIDKNETLDRLECIAVLKSPVEAKTHDSPSLVVNTLVSGVVAALVTYAFFLIISSLASTIVTEDDVKNMVGKPVMSAIPHWEITAKK